MLIVVLVCNFLLSLWNVFPEGDLDSSSLSLRVSYLVSLLFLSTLKSESVRPFVIPVLGAMNFIDLLSPLPIWSRDSPILDPLSRLNPANLISGILKEFS